MDVLVGPEVGEEDFAGVGADVCEGVENMTGVRVMLLGTVR